MQFFQQLQGLIRFSYAKTNCEVASDHIAFLEKNVAGFLRVLLQLASSVLLAVSLFPPFAIV